MRGGNPILFPFSARTFDRGDIHFWRAADGVRRPMPMHGIARQGDFEIKRMDAHGFIAQFLPNDESRMAYPYDYEFTVSYRFEPLGLSCEFTLKNQGTEPLPWSAGHHFYFAVPWSPEAKRSDYVIRIPASQHWKQDQKTGQLIPGPALQREENLSNPTLSDTIHTGFSSNEVRFGEKGQAGDIVVRNGLARVPPPDTAYVTWTADETVPYYCVEPWMGPPNAPETKVGLQHVPPGQVQSFIVTVELR